MQYANGRVIYVMLQHHVVGAHVEVDFVRVAAAKDQHVDGACKRVCIIFVIGFLLNGQVSRRKRKACMAVEIPKMLPQSGLVTC